MIFGDLNFCKANLIKRMIKNQASNPDLLVEMINSVNDVIMNNSEIDDATKGDLNLSLEKVVTIYKGNNNLFDDGGGFELTIKRTLKGIYDSFLGYDNSAENIRENEKNALERLKTSKEYLLSTMNFTVEPIGGKNMKIYNFILGSLDTRLKELNNFISSMEGEGKIMFTEVVEGMEKMKTWLLNYFTNNYTTMSLETKFENLITSQYNDFENQIKEYAQKIIDGENKEVEEEEEEEAETVPQNIETRDQNNAGLLSLVRLYEGNTGEKVFEKARELNFSFLDRDDNNNNNDDDQSTNIEYLFNDEYEEEEEEEEGNA